jgi:hypothetical protein
MPLLNPAGKNRPTKSPSVVGARRLGLARLLRSRQGLKAHTMEAFYRADGGGTAYRASQLLADADVVHRVCSMSHATAFSHTVQHTVANPIS